MTHSDPKDLLHEALDRTHIVSSHLQMALEEHPITRDNQDVQAAYEMAVKKIEELYQLIGSKLN